MALGDKWRHDSIVAARIVGPAVHEKDRPAIRGTVLLIGDVEDRRADMAESRS